MSDAERAVYRRIVLEMFKEFIEAAGPGILIGAADDLPEYAVDRDKLLRVVDTKIKELDPR